MTTIVLAWIFAISQTVYAFASSNDDQDFTLRSDASCQKPSIIAIALGGFCCLGAVVILLMIFLVLKHHEQITKYKQIIDKLIGGGRGGVAMKEVQKRMGDAKFNLSTSSDKVRKISSSTLSKTDVKQRSKIRKRQTKGGDVSVGSTSSVNEDNIKKTPKTTLPRPTPVGQDAKTSAQELSKLLADIPPKVSKLPAPKLVVLSSAGTVKSSGLGSTSSSTCRSLSYSLPTTDSTSSNTQE